MSGLTGLSGACASTRCEGPCFTVAMGEGGASTGEIGESTDMAEMADTADAAPTDRAPTESAPADRGGGGMSS